MEDRRVHQRFNMKEACIINHSEVVGSVIDISLGGLSCLCLDHDNCQQGCVDKVDLYCRQGIWAKGLSVRLLGSERIPGQFADEFSVRRCRLQFGQLAQDQLLQVENIILKSSLP